MKINLSGSWGFLPHANEFKSLNKSDFKEVTVPHTWNNLDGQDGGNDYVRDAFWYFKTFDRPVAGERFFIEFEGVNSISKVYLNDNFLGEHKGGYSTFRYDITELIEDTNELFVEVDNKHYDDIFPHTADFTFYGGIYRDVNLVCTSNTCFDLLYKGGSGVYISQKDINREKALIGVDCYIDNLKDDLSINVTVLDENKKTVLTKNIDEITNRHQQFDIEIDNPNLWQGIEDPYLYTIEVSLINNGVLIDSRSIPTGLRSFYWDEEMFYLNGIRTPLRGVSRHQDRETVGNALLKEHHDEDFAIMHELGVNSIRLAHYQQAQYVYDLCDKYGFIIWAEIPYITIPSKIDQTGVNPISQMEELVIQNYNHSSIVMWGVQNEITMTGKVYDVEKICSNLHDLTKEMDPYRVTTMAHVSTHPPKDSMNEITDTVAWNHYFGWYHGEYNDFHGWLDNYRELNPTRPLALSEYGVEGLEYYHTDDPQRRDYSEEYHALWHEKVYQILDSKPYMWGTYVWNMFAFAADFRDEGGVKGRNNKGLVSFDRKIRKDAFFFYQAAWSKTPMLHLTSKRYVNRPNKDITLKVYSNVDEVSFYLNDQLLEVVKGKTVFECPATLTEGSNQVKVTGAGLTDSAEYILVDSPDPEYSVPEEEKSKSIFALDFGNNWIDNVEVDEEMTFNEGFYSVKDKFNEIMESKAGDELVDKYFSSLKNHGLAAVVLSLSIERIYDMSPADFPIGIYQRINKALQQIEKK